MNSEEELDGLIKQKEELEIVLSELPMLVAYRDSKMFTIQKKKIDDGIKQVAEMAGDSGVESDEIVKHLVKLNANREYLKDLEGVDQSAVEQEIKSTQEEILALENGDVEDREDSDTDFSEESTH